MSSPDPKLIREGEPGSSYEPSNGTEFEYFYGAICATCIKDDKEDCEIIAYAAAFSKEDADYPEEWIYNRDGRPSCSAYQHREAGKDSPSLAVYRCPDTLNLFSGGKDET